MCDLEYSEIVNTYDNSGENLILLRKDHLKKLLSVTQKYGRHLKQNMMGIKEELKDLEYKVALGLEKAYQKMVKFKKMKNTPLIVSKDGKVIEIESEKIPPTAKPKLH